MTELEILTAVCERTRKDGETIREIMGELGIPITLANAQWTYIANSVLGLCVYMAMPSKSCVDDH